MLTDAEKQEDDKLKQEIVEILEGPNLPPEMYKNKAKFEDWNNSVSGKSGHELRRILRFYLEDKGNNFMVGLENLGSPASLTDQERTIAQELVLLYKTLAVSFIRVKESPRLKKIMDYCSVSSPFFQDVFAMICTVGHNACLYVAVKRIFKEFNDGHESIDEFMMREPARTLFNEHFYQRIVEHDRVPLIEAMHEISHIENWNKALMTELAEKGKYRNVAEYLKDPSKKQIVSDTRTDMDYEQRDDLADKIKESVKKVNLLKLEQNLQDLEGCKEIYRNVDNLLNEMVSTEEEEKQKVWKSEKLMHWACRQGNLALCKALYKRGASLRVVDWNFHTPAHVAIEENRLEVLQWLHSCDNNLLHNFFEYGWQDPILKDKYLFKVEAGNKNLPTIAFLLSLDCDQLLKDENIKDVLEKAINEYNGDSDCIDTLLKGKKVCDQIKYDLLKNEKVRKDNRLLEKLIVAAPRDTIEEMIDKEKDFFKEWKKTFPDVLPKVFAKFLGPAHSEKNAEDKDIVDVNDIGKEVFKELVKASKRKTLGADGKHHKNLHLLDNENVLYYIDNNLITILPYFFDVLLITLHLILFSYFCLACGDFRSKKALCGNSGIQYGFVTVNLFLTIKQFVEFSFKKCQYLKNVQDWLETISYILSFIVFFLPEHLNLIIFCLLVSVTNLFMKVMVMPCDFGLYMETFFSIFKRFLRLLPMFSMFFVCFIAMFHTLFRKAEPFGGFLSSISKTLAMMTGEFDFNSLFFPENSSDTTESSTSQSMAYPSTTAYIVFIMFCILMHLLLSNLLVGLAVDELGNIMETSKKRRLLKQADLIVDLYRFWQFVGFMGEFKAESFKKYLLGLIVACFTNRNDSNREHVIVAFIKRHSKESAKQNTTPNRGINIADLNDGGDQETKEEEPLIHGQTELTEQTVQESQEKSDKRKKTCLDWLKRYARRPCPKWIFTKLGLLKLERVADEPTQTADESMAMIRETLEKQQKEQDETAEALDLLKRAVFQVDNRNRDLIEEVQRMRKETGQILQILSKFTENSSAQ